MPVQIEEYLVTDRAHLFDRFLGHYKPLFVVSMNISHMVNHFSESDESLVAMFAFSWVIDIQLSKVMVFMLSIKS